MNKSSACVLFVLLSSPLTVLEVSGKCFASPGSSTELQTTAAWISRFPVIVKAAMISLDTHTESKATIEIQEIYKGILLYRNPKNSLSS